ncbi:HAD family hydrolase [Ensifer sp. ENS10]|uniref:HAD family hydrolase n=1 Tax=Ensifer sp. Root278 TaxID=1736509 RepID=UPI00070C0E1F|nr:MULTISPECIES: HAD family hydrolase [unclassified Ensifer]KRD72031.1 glycerol-3-phosphatase [Ensifer sp. Root278]MBD9507800.1 HAD family hydrolase [Ensifer sp. ENS10]MBV7518720.1 HAD family hydrolase [Ensifer sp. ENS12]
MDAAPSSVFTKNFAALLFDMDGTLLNSMAVVERVWGAWAVRNGIDPIEFIKTVHGVRAVDTIRNLELPDVDPEKEAFDLALAEIADVEGIVEIPGAVAFLNSLPPEKWAIVTSAPLDLAVRRLAAAGIPTPQLMITGEDVSVGKPDPQGYRMAAERLGVRPEDCLVFEDAPAGILAGLAAGADVVVVTGAHAAVEGTPHLTLDRYHEIEVELASDGTLSLRQTL